MKTLLVKIGNETHELPYNGGAFSFEVSEKYVPKVGDCVRVGENDLERATFLKIVFINNKGNIKSEHCVDLDKGKYTIDLDDFLFAEAINFTQITPEELKAKYAEAGYDWDYETNEVKPLKWTPKHWEEVWWLNLLYGPAKTNFNKNDNLLKAMAEKGFLFKTEEKCKDFAKYCSKYFDNNET